MNMENESLSLCEKARFAVIFDEPKDVEIENHLCECKLCRTALEQHKKLKADLSTLGAVSFLKNGKSVSDCVMEEIEKQSIFTGARPVNASFGFRHAGLVAACLIITVMALPLLKGILPANKSDDFAVADEDVQYNSSVFEEGKVSDGLFDKLENANGSNILADEMKTEESFDYSDYEAPEESVAESVSGTNAQNTVTNHKTQSGSSVKDDSVNSEVYLYSDVKDYSDKHKDIVIMSPSQPTADSSEQEAAQEPECNEAQTQQSIDTKLYEISFEAAKIYCTENSLNIINDMVSIIDEKQSTVCVVFETYEKIQVRVLLKMEEIEYAVLNVWADK